MLVYGCVLLLNGLFMFHSQTGTFNEPSILLYSQTGTFNDPSILLYSQTDRLTTIINRVL